MTGPAARRSVAEQRNRWLSGEKDDMKAVALMV